jgi:hypothetical protein
VNCKISLLFPTIFVVLGVSSAFAAVKNLGVVGELYQVVEPNLLTELKQQAVAKSSVEKDAFLKRVKTY